MSTYRVDHGADEGSVLKDWRLLATLIAFVAYGFVFIARTSFLVDGLRYFSLADDQLISMRYAEHLARGDGLVWNAGGPRVEGFTNFLWTLYMALFHRLGFERRVTSVGIQVSGVLLLAGALVVLALIADQITPRRRAGALTAVGLTAFYYPLLNWAVLGTEVSLLTLMTVLASALALRAIDDGRRAPWALYCLLGLSTLVRPDMLITAVAVLGGLAWVQPLAARRHLLIGGGVVAGFIATATLGRLLYFDQLLPNTYYLKMTGYPLILRLTRGTLVTLLFAIESIALLASAWLGRSRWCQPGVHLLLVIVGVQVLYNVFIGGDAWEHFGGSNRFIAIVIPLLAILGSIGLDQAGIYQSGSAIFIVVGLILMTNYTALVFTNDAPIRRLLLLRTPSQDEDEIHVRQGVTLRQFTDDRAIIAVVTAGGIPYFSERQSADMLGKSDMRIAHEPMHLPRGWLKWVAFWPGHMKWDFDYSIRMLKPDVIQVVVRENPTTFDPRPYAENDYVFWNGW